MRNAAAQSRPARLGALARGMRPAPALHPVTDAAPHHWPARHAFKNRLSLRRHHPEPTTRWISRKGGQR
ncbi:hypothetical protein BLAT2472_50480 [Burkholderia latens]